MASASAVYVDVQPVRNIINPVSKKIEFWDFEQLLGHVAVPRLMFQGGKASFWVVLRRPSASRAKSEGFKSYPVRALCHASTTAFLSIWYVHGSRPHNSATRARQIVFCPFTALFKIAVETG